MTVAVTLCLILVAAVLGFAGGEVDDGRGPMAANSRTPEMSVFEDGCIGGPDTAGLIVFPPEAAAGISTQALLYVFLPCRKRFFSEDSPWNRPISSYKNVHISPIDALEDFDSPGFSLWTESGWVAIHRATEDDPVRGLYFHKDCLDQSGQRGVEEMG